MKAPVAALQIRAVLSQDAVTMRLPSGLNAADVTDARMPLELGDEGPAVRPSRPAPSVPRRGDDAAAVRAERGGIDRARMPLELGDEGPGVGRPDPRRTVPRRGDDAAAVGAERGGSRP